MDKATFDNYIRERYLEQMAYYDESSLKNQARYKKFQWVLIILSAITPVFAALNGFKFSLFNTPYEIKDLNIWVVITSSIVAILTTGLKTFNYQELWVKYRSTHEKLKPEIYYYTFNIGPYAAADIDKETVFVTRVEAILDSEHAQWPFIKKNAEKAEEPKAADGADDNKEN